MTYLLWIAVLLLSAIGLGSFFYIQNRLISVTEQTIDCPRLPTSFDGLRVVQLSDLHGTWFGKNQEKLLARIEKQKPDMIIITGDIIDKRRTRPGEYAAALCLIAKARELAPVYYAAGNHEWQSGLIASLAPKLEQAGAAVLLGAAVTVRRGGEEIAVLGAQEPASFEGILPWNERRRAFFGCLDALCRAQDGRFLLVLSHRPELFKLYVLAGADLVFCGHAHGGQIRLPFLGGLYMPDQGWLPAYDSGLYTMGETAMMVSRGLGNSAFPIRLFNRPEIVSVTLRGKKGREAAAREG